MAKLLKPFHAASRAAARRLAVLERRGDAILDGTVRRRTNRIVDGVRRGGDRALLAAVRRFDGVRARRVSDLRLEVPSMASIEGLPAGFELAFERAVAQVEAYHRRQVQGGFRLAVDGVELMERRLPLRRVAIYVPGGRAAYPSTVAMTAVPARVAGVEEIVVVTPLRGWARSPALRFALARLGIEEVWGLGGAQAIAALAYGTETVQRVDKIIGPGNSWVTAAKHRVSSAVAIDGLAGPSEVVIVASGEPDPELMAADLLAQAEHDPAALAVLISDSRRHVKAVRRALRRQLRPLPTAAVARAALTARGAAFVVEDMESALAIVQRLAPEHVQLVGEAAEELAERVTAAGAIFLGADTPEVFGDYIAGPSHVLPTSGTARYASGLGVDDFTRRCHQVRFDRGAAARCAGAAAELAAAEGLPAHAAAARLRARSGEPER